LTVMPGKAIFSTINLDKKLDQAAYDEIIPGLRERLGEFQRKARDAGIPTMIIFEGWEASGKGTQMNRLLMALDPRGFKTYAIDKPLDAEKERPFFWRFWIKTPPRGEMAIYSTSWYGQTLLKVFRKKMKDGQALERYNEAKLFEKTLSDDGYLIIKLFLHISKKEQKARLDKIEKEPFASWLVTDTDRDQNKSYGRYRDAVEAMVESSDSAYAPWTIVEAEDKRFATVKIYRTVIAAMEKRLAPARQKKPVPPAKEARKLILNAVDLSKSLPEDEYKQKLENYQDTIKRLQYMAYRADVPVVIVFEGWDAAGKDGGIRRLTENMDPRGYQVNSYGAPNDVQRSFNYLWRFWKEMPSRGSIAIFDRSWYGRVLVERVEGFCTPADWTRAYGEINEMERELADFGAIILKFWLHISWDEQLKRFERRELDPFKTYKLTDEDWRNREKWDKYLVAADDMFVKTSTPYAPWTIVESNDKHYSRIKILETAIAALEEKVGKP
jgi:polyphosphate:AMP phosphotransferase